MLPEHTGIVIRSALNRNEISQLTKAIDRCMHSGLEISSFVYAANTSNPILVKIRDIVQRVFDHELLYLNDFYLYTDGLFQAGWHIDTEMFSFDRAVNVWIPLDDTIKIDPIAFISGINDRRDNYYHSISADGSNYEFMNLVDFKEEVRPIDEVENSCVLSGEVAFGDMLLLNPRRFHRTNCRLPKHAFIIKFVMAGEAGLRAVQTVPAVVWPEVALFDEFMALGDNWSIAMSRLHQYLSDPEQRQKLTAGFFPDQVGLFRHKISELITEQEKQNRN